MTANTFDLSQLQAGDKATLAGDNIDVVGEVMRSGVNPTVFFTGMYADEPDSNAHQLLGTLLTANGSPDLLRPFQTGRLIIGGGGELLMAVIGPKANDFESSLRSTCLKSWQVTRDGKVVFEASA